MATTTLADTLATLQPFLAPLAQTAITLSRASPADATKIQTALTGVNSGLADLAASDTAAQSKPIVQRFETDALTIVNAVPADVWPFPYNIVVQIAKGMLPALMSSVTLLLQHKVDVTALPAVAAPVPVAA